jgi:hypothetical protein
MVNDRVRVALCQRRRVLRVVGSSNRGAGGPPGDPYGRVAELPADLAEVVARRVKSSMAASP